MKTAIYIEDGLLQVVITPESDFEKQALSAFRSEKIEAHLFSGTFYDCRGGWIRQSAHGPRGFGNEGDHSLIIRATKPEEDVDNLIQREIDRISGRPETPSISSREELNKHLDRETQAGENHILRAAGKLDDLIAAGEPHSNAE